MSTIRGVKDRRFKFVQLLNSMFEDPKISLKSKGFIGYCLKNKEDYSIQISYLCSVLKEGETAIYSTINECIENGYAFRFQPRDKKGRTLPIEFYISDSKDEIELIKKEVENKFDLNKCLPVRGNPDADNPDAEKEEPVFTGENARAIYNNTNCNNTINQQQQAAAPAAAVFSEKKEKKIAIFECLDLVDIPKKDKIEISSRYDQETVRNAIGWSTHANNPPTKSLVASIKYACKNGLSSKEFDQKKESVYETLKSIFTDGQIYNNAECILNSSGITFFRGSHTDGLKFDKFFSFKRFHEILASFQIDLTQIA